MDRFPTEKTYTLDDLDRWDRSSPSLAVLGFPVRHSISPAMHNAAIERLNEPSRRFDGWKYFRFETRPEDLVAALPKFYEKGFFGLNLTVPHKEVVLPALDRIAPEAKEIGAVNTLKRAGHGYEGFNTDGYGLEQGIRLELNRAFEDSHTYILGAGGAGRAAAVQALRSSCRSLTLVNRNQERLANLLSVIAPIARERSIPISGHAPGDSELEFASGALVINATSLGLKPDDALPVPERLLNGDLTLYDMIYNPTRTKLMSAVSNAGGTVANGLSMLVHQGVRALEIWTDTPIEATVMDSAARDALA